MVVGNRRRVREHRRGYCAGELAPAHLHRRPDPTCAIAPVGTGALGETPRLAVELAQGSARNRPWSVPEARGRPLLCGA